MDASKDISIPQREVSGMNCLFQKVMNTGEMKHWYFAFLIQIDPIVWTNWIRGCEKKIFLLAAFDPPGKQMNGCKLSHAQLSQMWLGRDNPYSRRQNLPQPFRGDFSNRTGADANICKGRLRVCWEEERGMGWGTLPENDSSSVF